MTVYFFVFEIWFAITLNFKDKESEKIVLYESIYFLIVQILIVVILSSLYIKYKLEYEKKWKIYCNGKEEAEEVLILGKIGSYVVLRKENFQNKILIKEEEIKRMEIIE